MQRRLVAILVLNVFKGILSYCTTCPSVCPPCQPVPPCTANPQLVDGFYKCGYFPEYSIIFSPIECEMMCPPMCLDIPCGIEKCPACSCYRDIREPCVGYDEPAPTCTCFECFDSPGSAPCIYFPLVEYPVSVMDIKPYFYGNCWCT